MTRRSTPQKKTDELAFPVRILLRELMGGYLQELGPGRDPHQWIGEHLGHGEAALYGWGGRPHAGIVQLLCRSIQDAERFLAAFPEFKLADGTAEQTYFSPYVFGGKRIRERD